jgi:hypothetical protein
LYGEREREKIRLHPLTDLYSYIKVVKILNFHSMKYQVMVQEDGTCMVHGYQHFGGTCYLELEDRLKMGVSGSSETIPQSTKVHYITSQKT